MQDTQSVAGSEQTSLDQCTEYLFSKAKLQKDRGTIRIAVHQFVPKGGPSDPSATYGDGISAAVERSMLRIQEVQVVTRRRLRDLQMEQKLNQAEWNESGEKDGRLGIGAVDFIVRGTYSGVSRSSAQTLDVELLEPRTGQIIAAKGVTLHGF
jgi:TolB-like protein